MRYQQDLQVSIRERLRRLLGVEAEDAVHALPPVASASKLGKPAPVIITRDDLVDPDATDAESD